MRHANQSIFSQVKGPNVERSKISAPSILKTTLNPDLLYPIFVHKCIPGDTHRLNMHNFARMTCPLKSVPMDNLWMDTFWFFVPHRLVWTNFQRFMGEQDNPDDSTDYTYPKLDTYRGMTLEGVATTYQFGTGSIFDYMGLPTKVDFPHASLTDNFISAIPLRGYNLIMHYWFRDQNLMDAPYLTKGDGPDPLDYEVDGTDVATYKLWTRCKNRDYFTSALPEPQKGPAVEIPIGSIAPVYGNGRALGLDNDTYQHPMASFNDTGLTESTSTPGQYNGSAAIVSAQFNATHVGVLTKSHSGGVPENTGLYASLEDATATTINEFRLLFATQRYYERKMRGGSRYKEIVQSFFGVSVPDFRVQWPELLGISSQNMQTNEIMQSSGTGATGTSTALGQLAGQMKTANSRFLFNKSIVEHGYIIGLANIRADITYYQGIDRHWTESTVFDEYWPQFGHIGEQAILNRELYYKGDDGTYDMAVFGYQSAWSWLKYKNNKITGQMRPNATINFKQWHLAQTLVEPILDDVFRRSAVPISNVASSTTADYFMVDFLFDLESIRCVPFNTDPGMLDHF